jgi:hypothetical protein
LKNGPIVALRKIDRSDEGVFEAWKWDDDKDWVRLDDDRAPRSIHLPGLRQGRSQVGVPVYANAQPVAIVWFHFDTPVPPLPAAKMSALESFRALTGFAVMSVRHRDFRAANNLAHLIRPTFYSPRLSLNGLSLGFKGSPIGAAIGGDFVDVVQRESEDSPEAVILLGDAKSHGLAGALLMVPLLTGFRLSAKESGSPRFVIEQLYRVARMIPENYATAICMSLRSDAEGAILSVASAGHPPLTLFPQQGEPLPFPADYRSSQAISTGPSLSPDLPCPQVAEVACRLAKGVIVVACTDGITDVFDAQTRTQFMVSDARPKIQGARAKGPQAVAEAVYESALEFGQGRLADDATVLVIQVDGRGNAGDR